MSGIDFFDSVLITLIAGVCSINLLLFLLYIISRITERDNLVARSRSAQNKADRPFWIVGCLISGTIWMVTTLILSGDFDIFQSDDSHAKCVLLKILMQYTFGYILWINLIIYRLFRLFMVHAWVVKPLHAMVVLSILQAPFIIFSVAAFATDTTCLPSSDIVGYWTCRQSIEWNVPLYCLAAIYLFIFVFFTIKVSRVTGTFKDLKRYIFFCGVSFLFLIFDASMNLSDSWTYITIRRLLCFFVFVIVTAQSWSIFWSVLLRKRVKKPKDFRDGGDGSIMILDEHKPQVGPLEINEDQLMGAPIRRTYSVEPSQYETEHYSVRSGIYVPTIPREGVDEFFNPDFRFFSEKMTNEDNGRFETSYGFIDHFVKGINFSIDRNDVENSLNSIEAELSNPTVSEVINSN